MAGRSPTTAARFEYFPLLTFTAREVADAFSAAVVAAILEHDPRAFDVDDAAPARSPVRDAMDSEFRFERKRTKTMSIDLDSFCCDDPERPYFSQPFSLNEHTYATDGAICVRIGRRADIPENKNKEA